MADLVYKRLQQRKREFTAYMILHAAVGRTECNVHSIRHANGARQREGGTKFCIHSAEYEKLRATAKNHWPLRWSIGDTSFKQVPICSSGLNRQS
jgi:hypothetical protein